VEYFRQYHMDWRAQKAFFDVKLLNAVVVCLRSSKLHIISMLPNLEFLWWRHRSSFCASQDRESKRPLPRFSVNQGVKLVVQGI
jgi:hypothetical protein